jgi:hypothetical protein
MKRKERSLFRSSSSHLHKCAVLLTILAGLLAGPASAARVEWSRGGTDLAIESAQRCTLDVVFTPEEAIYLREWRLVWVVDEDNGPVRVVMSDGSAEPAEACDVRHDLAGRRLATLVERDLEAGRHEFRWDGATDHGVRCAAGIYFCRVDCGGVSTMTRFVRLSGNR